MPPSIAETGMGLASSGGPGTLRAVGGRGTLIAATAAVAAVATADVLAADSSLVTGGWTVLSLGPGVEVFEEGPLESVESGFPFLLVSPFCSSFPLFPLIFSLASF